MRRRNQRNQPKRQGIARIKGLVIFEPNTKVGDNVNIQVTRVSSWFAEAEVVVKNENESEEKEENEQ
jgi:predicted RNA-binding protein with TRAM domain